MKKNINVKNITISLFEKEKLDYISLTDIARFKNPNEPKDIVKNWMRNRNTVEFLGLWEVINNTNFKGVEFDSFRQEAGLNSFTLSPLKWIEQTNAIGLISKSGKGGGTFAYKDIAFEFASWISPEFKLYLIKEFQRLKEEENIRSTSGWNVKRLLTKINYRIHTDAIKENLIPPIVSRKVAERIYSSEADVLNIALFGLTAKGWRDKYPNMKGNIRDYSNIIQLICLANLESFNAEFIRQCISQSNRIMKLNEIAIIQMKSLIQDRGIKELEVKE